MAGVDGAPARASGLVLVEDGTLPLGAVARTLGETAKGVSGGVWVLSFREFLTAGERAALRAAVGERVRFLDGAREIAGVAETVSADLTRFVADFPRQPLHRNRSFLELFADQGCPLWWYGELSQKNGPRVRVYWELFKAYAAAAVLDRTEAGTCLVACDGPLTRLVAEAAGRRGRKVLLAGRRAALSWGWMVKIAGQRLRAMTYLVLGLILVRVDRNGRRAFRAPGGPRALAFTWYPRAWRQRGGVWEDIYYGSNLATLAEQWKAEPLHVLRVYDEDIGGVRPDVMWRRLRRLDDPAARPPESWVLLEQFSSVREVLRLFLNPLSLLQYWRLDRDRRYRSLFRIGEFDVDALFRAVMWRSVAVYWPAMLALSGAVQRAARDLGGDVAIFYSFEFLHGRAISAGLRRGGVGFQIGLQHGPIARNKLVYLHRPSEFERWRGQAGLPGPDEYWVDGEIASRILEENGVDRSRIRIVGASRLAALLERRRQVGPGAGAPPARLLVVAGLHDPELCVRFVAEAATGLPGVDVVVKLHPKTPPVQAKDGRGGRVRVIREGALPDLFAAADVVLTDYSSAGFEALLVGVPLVLIAPANAPDRSPFAGEESAILRVSSPEELRAVVERLLGDEEFREAYVCRSRADVERLFGDIVRAANCA